MNNIILKNYKSKLGVNLFVLITLLLLIFIFPARAAAAYDGEFTPPDKAKLEEILKDIDAYAEKGLKDWQIPGMAVGIVQGDKLIFARGYGVRNLETKDPVNPGTLFQIGSTSKAFTCTLAAMMVQEGKLGWEDRVIDHLPDFRLKDPWVTREFLVTDTMAQRSGLQPYSGDFMALLDYSRDQIIHAIRYLKPITSFRSSFAYQNHMFLVAAKLVEKVSGKTWEENIQERIFKPLAMNSSSMDLKSFVESDNSCTLYIRDKGKIKSISPDGIGYRWVYTYGPAGGINSNINDMSKWLRFQMGEGQVDGKALVSKKNLDYMHSPKTVVAPDVDPDGGKYHQYYCQGWVYRENGNYPMIWHTGGTTGCKTMLAFVPKAKVGVIVLTNVENKLADAVAEKFFDMYLGRKDYDYSGEYLEKAKKKWKAAEADIAKPPASPVPSLPLKAYTGKYENGWCKNARIVQEGKSLYIILGPRNNKFVLKHQDRDRFTMAPILGDEEEMVLFLTDFDGNVTGMKIDAFASGGCDTFSKSEEKK